MLRGFFVNLIFAIILLLERCAQIILIFILCPEATFIHGVQIPMGIQTLGTQNVDIFTFLSPRTYLLMYFKYMHAFHG